MMFLLSRSILLFIITSSSCPLVSIITAYPFAGESDYLSFSEPLLDETVPVDISYDVLANPESYASIDIFADGSQENWVTSCTSESFLIPLNASPYFRFFDFSGKTPDELKIQFLCWKALKSRRTHSSTQVCCFF